MKNNKGFAITTIVYSILILLSLSMFIVLEVAKNSYENEKEYMSDVNEELNNFLITKEFADNFEYTKDFIYSGAGEEWTVPKTGYYQIEAWGAQGGVADYSGGKGSYTKGEIYLVKNEKLYIYVGGRGSAGNNTSGGTGGYNGGGKGGQDSNPNGGAGGGGATDVRYFTTTPTVSDLEWNSELGLNSRIMVAAGGAGSAGYDGSGTMSAGGGLTGYLNGGLDTSVSQSEGSAFGVGGTSGIGLCSGGSGGGYYVKTMTTNYSNGYGGSSYISGHAGCISINDMIETKIPRTILSNCSAASTNIECSYHKNLISRVISLEENKYFQDTKMIDGNGYNWTTIRGTIENMPTQDGTSTMTGNAGDGFAKITYLGTTLN